jgi:hypothetical protein
MTVTRYIHGAEEAAQVQQPAAVESTRVHNGSLSFQTGTDTGPVHRSQASYIVTHDGTSGGSVMDTLRRDSNGPSVELIPGNPASRTVLAQALKAGLVEEFAPGQYRDAQDQQARVGQQQGDPPQDEKAQEDPGAGVFNAEDDREWATAIEPLPQHSFDSAMASGVAVVAHGQGTFEDTAKSLAKSSGMEVDEALAYVSEGYAMYERAVARGLGPLGLCGERLQAFYDSTRENPERLQDALQRVLHGRDVGGFKEMAIAWVVKNPGPEVQALKAAGFEVFVDRETGEALARRAGGDWVSASRLLKA